MGAQIPGDHHVLAPALAGGDPVLRLPPRRPPDYLHHERDRGLERQAAPGRPHLRPLPERRGCTQAPLPGLEPGRAGMENAAPGMEDGQGPVRDPVRRPLPARLNLMINPWPAHGIPDSPAELRRRPTEHWQSHCIAFEEILAKVEAS